MFHSSSIFYKGTRVSSTAETSYEGGSVKIQYFCYVMPSEGFPRLKEDQMCWYIGTLALGLSVLYLLLRIPILTATET